ncbi:MAG: OmpH family outer membrane protein [Gammaproteobacteria bacterium]
MRYGFFAAGVLAAGLSFVTVAQAADAPQIGVANLQQVVDNSHRGQGVDTELQSMVNDLNSKIADRRKKLEAVKKELDSTDKKSSKFATMQSNFQDEAASFQQFAYTSQQNFNQTKQQKLQPVYDELKKVMIAYAKDHKYDIIESFNDNGVVYVTDKYDLTSELTEAMDKDWAELQKTQTAPAAKGK